MSGWDWYRAALLGIALANIGLTVWHARILVRARRHQADTARLHDAAARLLDELTDAAPPMPIAENAHNGTRPATDHKEGPEP